MTFTSNEITPSFSTPKSLVCSENENIQKSTESSKDKTSFFTGRRVAIGLATLGTVSAALFFAAYLDSCNQEQSRSDLITKINEAAQQVESKVQENRLLLGCLPDEFQGECNTTVTLLKPNGEDSLDLLKAKLTDWTAQKATLVQESRDLNQSFQNLTQLLQEKIDETKKTYPKGTPDSIQLVLDKEATSIRGLRELSNELSYVKKYEEELQRFIKDGEEAATSFRICTTTNERLQGEPVLYPGDAELLEQAKQIRTFTGTEKAKRLFEDLTTALRICENTNAALAARINNLLPWYNACQNDIIAHCKRYPTVVPHILQPLANGYPMPKAINKVPISHKAINKMDEIGIKRTGRCTEDNR